MRSGEIEPLQFDLSRMSFIRYSSIGITSTKVMKHVHRIQVGANTKLLASVTSESVAFAEILFVSQSRVRSAWMRHLDERWPGERGTCNAFPQNLIHESLPGLAYLTVSA